MAPFVLLICIGDDAGGVDSRCVCDAMHTGRSDIWSLGVVAYYLLSSELPFGSEEHSEQEIVGMIQYKEPTPLQEVCLGAQRAMGE